MNNTDKLNVHFPLPTSPSRGTEGVLKEWYVLSRRREFLDSHDEQEAWSAIQNKIAQRRRMRLWRRWGGVAAMMIIIGGATLWWTNGMTTDSDDSTVQVAAITQKMSSHQADIQTIDGKKTYAVPMGAEYSARMSDGTEVVMNAGTQLKYAEHFDGNTREVELTGEAYFAVAHDEKKPFIVNTPSGSIEVLGTHFNVIAEADMTTVTLEEGSVRLHFGDREFMMKPGEQARMMSDGSIDVRHVNATNYTSWSTGVYEFDNAPLDEITRQLSLWYDVEMDINDNALADRRFTGIIMRNEPLEDAINMLTTVSDIKIRVKNSKLLITN